MSQHDFDIANQGFAAFRTDLNNALKALGSLSSGTTAPVTAYANQLWYETDTDTLWLRNEANSAWLSVMVINQSTGSPSFTAGNVGIGTSSPSYELEVAGTGDIITASSVTTAGFLATTTTANIAYCALINSARSWNIRNNAGGSFVIRDQTAALDRVTIDTSGSVGIGTTTPNSLLHVAGGGALIGDFATNSSFFMRRAEGTIAAPTQITASSILAAQAFSGLDNTSTYRDVAQIRATSDGAITSTSSPGYLAFRTTPSGTVATVERMRIASDGGVTIASTAAPASLITTTTDAGSGFAANGSGVFSVGGGTTLYLNRLTSDGTLVDFRQAGVSEGTISVSGTTVSYNGGHLSRWAQFPDNSRPELLKGTVMSNLDQMSNWDNEENEQLNCVEISTVEGDANVAGLFVAWDSTEDDYNDILLAMTGDMVIRIAAGVTVARGDLLMSAGDGTAKPQADDIIRAKTIAKVTSNHVSHTYTDGSYAVPCVVMAC